MGNSNSNTEISEVLQGINLESSFDEVQAKAIFDKFDKDKNGTLDKYEVKAFLCEYIAQKKISEDPEQIVNQFMRAFGVDGDGAITFKDITRGAYQSMKGKNPTKYASISHRWQKGFVVKEPMLGEDHDAFWAKQSSAYSSIMYQSQDDGKTWSIYKTKGFGAIDAIKKEHQYILFKYFHRQRRLSTTGEIYTYSGFLTKQSGPLTGRKKRFFVLEAFSLDYYVDYSMKMQKGSIPLSSILIINPEASQGDSDVFNFRIKTKEKEYIFSAVSHDDKLKWISHLTNALAEADVSTLDETTRGRINSMMVQKKSPSQIAKELERPEKLVKAFIHSEKQPQFLTCPVTPTSDAASKKSNMFCPYCFRQYGARTLKKKCRQCKAQACARCVNNTALVPRIDPKNKIKICKKCKALSDLKQTQLTCPANHLLKPINTSSPNWWCSVCETDDISIGSQLLRCHECDWNCCERCAKDKSLVVQIFKVRNLPSQEDITEKSSLSVKIKVIDASSVEHDIIQKTCGLVKNQNDLELTPNIMEKIEENHYTDDSVLQIEIWDNDMKGKMSWDILLLKEKNINGWVNLCSEKEKSNEKKMVEFKVNIKFHLDATISSMNSTTSIPETKERGSTLSKRVNVNLTIKSATNVPKMDRFGKSDPFVKILSRLPNGKIIEKYTTTRFNTLNPKWVPAESFRFSDLSSKGSIQLELYDKDPLSSEYIGSGSLNLDATSFSGKLVITSSFDSKGKDIILEYEIEIINRDFDVEEELEVFKVGQKVRVNIRGKQPREGVIRSPLKNECYYIHFTDDETEQYEALWPRSLVELAPKFQMGDRVQVTFAGRTHQGVIAKRVERVYDILYDNGEKEKNIEEKRIDPAKISKKGLKSWAIGDDANHGAEFVYEQNLESKTRTIGKDEIINVLQIAQLNTKSKTEEIYNDAHNTILSITNLHRTSISSFPKKKSKKKSEPAKTRLHVMVPNLSMETIPSLKELNGKLIIKKPEWAFGFTYDCKVTKDSVEHVLAEEHKDDNKQPLPPDNVKKSVIHLCNCKSWPEAKNKKKFVLKTGYGKMFRLEAQEPGPTRDTWLLHFRAAEIQASMQKQKSCNFKKRIINDNDFLRIAYFLNGKSNLTNLILTNNTMTSSSARALAEALENNTLLKHLDLGNNKISDTEVIPFSFFLKKNSTLAMLSLSKNAIGDDGAEIIAEGLEDNHGLKRLYLHTNMITDIGAKSIARCMSIHNSTLVNLDILTSNKIGKEGEASLKKQFQGKGNGKWLS